MFRRICVSSSWVPKLPTEHRAEFEDQVAMTDDVKNRVEAYLDELGPDRLIENDRSWPTADLLIERRRTNFL